MRLRGGIGIETGALVLIGGALDFAELANVLRSGEIEVVPIEIETGLDPIDSLRVEPAEGMATIDSSSGAATLRGSRESLNRVAWEIESFLEHNDLDEPGMHTHIGPPSSVFADELVLAPTSRELMLLGPMPEET